PRAFERPSHQACDQQNASWQAPKHPGSPPRPSRRWHGGIGCGVDFFDSRNKAVALARNRVNELGLAGVVGQSAANFAYRRIKRVLCFDVNILAPDLFHGFLMRDQPAGVFDKKEEEFEGSAVELDGLTVATQFEIQAIELVGAEFIHRGWHSAGLSC